VARDSTRFDRWVDERAVFNDVLAAAGSKFVARVIGDGLTKTMSHAAFERFRPSWREQLTGCPDSTVVQALATMLRVGVISEMLTARVIDGFAPALVLAAWKLRPESFAGDSAIIPVQIPLADSVWHVRLRLREGDSGWRVVGVADFAQRMTAFDAIIAAAGSRRQREMRRALESEATARDRAISAVLRLSPVESEVATIEGLPWLALRVAVTNASRDTVRDAVVTVSVDGAPGENVVLTLSGPLAPGASEVLATTEPVDGAQTAVSRIAEGGAHVAVARVERVVRGSASRHDTLDVIYLPPQ
jgi:hypothetical protein